ncbi:MAG: hypothetical protein GX275_13985 [Clostridiales bacterium]|nr:hypothetical protein [Clostridiales bacterium]
MKKELMNYKSIRVIVILALFNFIFLGTEYMFDNMMANVIDSKGVVAAQSYIFGASVIGFILFPIINRFIKEKNKFSIVFATSMVSIICIFIIKQHTSYKSILISGLVIFVILGIVGSAVHYIAACALNNRKNLAKTVGMAYGVGILLQFINNNFINNDTTESMVLWVFLVILLF